MFTLEAIIDNGATPILVEGAPSLGGKGPKCSVKKAVFNSSLDCNIEQNHNEFISRLFKEVKQRYSQIIIIKPGELFCENNTCQMSLNNIPLYRDDNHLNEDGARMLAQEYLKQKGNFLKE